MALWFNLKSISKNIILNLYFRDEQYRIMWNELETLVRAHINNSEKHQRVLECLMACRSKPPEEEERKKRGRKREDKEDKSEKTVKDYEQEKSWQDSERWLVDNIIVPWCLLACHILHVVLSNIQTTFNISSFNVCLFHFLTVILSLLKS